MAAGSVVCYMVGIEDFFQQLWDGDSATVVAHLCSAAYTPSAPSHSNWVADISAAEGQWTGYAAKVISAGIAIDRPDTSHIRFDMADITFSSTSLMDAKYCVLERQSNNRPLCYMDLETGATSGIAATQIIVQWPSTGVFRIRQTGL